MGIIIVNIPTAKPATARPRKLISKTCSRLECFTHTSKRHGDINRRSLESGTNSEDDDRNHNRSFAAKAIGHWAVDERAKPGSEQEGRYEPTLEGAVGRNPRKVCSEALHGENAGHHTLVITKKEATKRGKLGTVSDWQANAEGLQHTADRPRR